MKIQHSSDNHRSQSLCLRDQCSGGGCQRRPGVFSKCAGTVTWPIRTRQGRSVSERRGMIRRSCRHWYRIVTVPRPEEVEAREQGGGRAINGKAEGNRYASYLHNPRRRWKGREDDPFPDLKDDTEIPTARLYRTILEKVTA